VASTAETQAVDAFPRGLVWGFAVTETISWGVLFYALPVLLVPMGDDLGWSRSTIVGAFSLAIVVSGLAAPVVGRRLDRTDPRWLLTGGSVLATGLVLAWSQVESLVVYYGIWLAIGVVKAVVLYDAAFTIIIKRSGALHQRGILIVTLVAGLASFIFQPLTSALATAYDWRAALVVLAVILGVVTVPVHWVVLRPTTGAPRAVAPPAGRGRPPELRDPRFWRLTGAFTASATASFTTVILLVAYLTDQGWTLGAAAAATGTLGLMQLPGRLAFGALAGRLPRRALATGLFGLPALGLLLLLVSDGNGLVWPAVVILGVAQGTAILLRAVLLVDVFGVERIGVLTGIGAVPVTLVRAVAPVGATVLAAAVGGYVPVFGLLILASVVAAVLVRQALEVP
jgi:cyanate permease